MAPMILSGALSGPMAFNLNNRWNKIAHRTACWRRAKIKSDKRREISEGVAKKTCKAGARKFLKMPTYPNAYRVQ